MHLSDLAGEGVLLAGGARAILLQLAHPAVGRGVAEHSAFAEDPLRRLRGTLTYIYVVAFGTAEEIALVANAVGAAHARVRGPGYDASDPQLQLWVAATLYDTAVELHRRVFGPLPAAQAEAVYRDYAVLGSALGMPRELWPADRTAFREYWTITAERLAVDQTILRVARELLYPRRAPAWLRAGMPLIRLVTAGLLTGRERDLFGLPWSERRRRRFELAMRITAAVYPRLPRRIRHWPKDHYLRRFRRWSGQPQRG